MAISFNNCMNLKLFIYLSMYLQYLSIYLYISISVPVSILPQLVVQLSKLLQEPQVWLYLPSAAHILQRLN